VVGFHRTTWGRKSTLIGALTKATREAGRTVASCRSTRPRRFTHGALLGDRIRLSEHFLDQGVFIRSMANRGALGGPVGGGPAGGPPARRRRPPGRVHRDGRRRPGGDRHHRPRRHDRARADARVGDSIQALKAGVMEIPDVIVINKADHPLTDTMVREIRGVLSLANLDRSPEEVRGAGACRSSRQRRRGGRECRSSSRASSSIAPTSLGRVSWQSAEGATCTTRSWRSPPPACGAASRRASPGRGVQAPARGGRRAPARPRQRGQRAVGARPADAARDRVGSAGDGLPEPGRSQLALLRRLMGGTPPSTGRRTGSSDTASPARRRCC